jgi:hypothetical protein
MSHGRDRDQNQVSPIIYIAQTTGRDLTTGCLQFFKIENVLFIRIRFSPNLKRRIPLEKNINNSATFYGEATLGN